VRRWEDDIQGDSFISGLLWKQWWTFGCCKRPQFLNQMSHCQLLKSSV